MHELTFGQWLERERVARGWKQSYLAGEMDVSQSTISRWLMDAVVPEPDHCRRLARLLDVPQVEVFRRAGHITETETSVSRPADYAILEGTERLSIKEQRELYSLLRSIVIHHLRQGEQEKEEV